jgi:hypothetical protein
MRRIYTYELRVRSAFDRIIETAGVRAGIDRRPDHGGSTGAVVKWLWPHLKRGQ